MKGQNNELHFEKLSAEYENLTKEFKALHDQISEMEVGTHCFCKLDSKSFDSQKQRLFFFFSHI